MPVLMGALRVLEKHRLWSEARILEKNDSLRNCFSQNAAGQNKVLARYEPDLRCLG